MFIEMIKLNIYALFSDFLGNQFHHFQQVLLYPNIFADNQILDFESLLDTFFAKEISVLCILTEYDTYG